MSARKLNVLEQRIHQAALAVDNKTITIKEVEVLSPDAALRAAAINFLLSAGLLKPLQDNKGKLTGFRAVGKKEVEIKKELTDEEALVLSHIQAAGNEGIWSKHIKVKTELHQTVLDRCLKSLTQKQLVKALKGTVQHPTRKMYILFNLEPSVEVTGGPWYTDKELDTEFIKMLLKACLKFISDRSQPRIKSGGESSSERKLYPISASPSYPSATQIQTFLNKSRITETQLSVEHVEMLLEVLVLDGEVEKVPAMGAALWDSATAGPDESESEEEITRKGKKRKRDDRSEGKRKKKPRMLSDSGTESKSDVSTGKKGKGKRKIKYDSHQESDSEGRSAKKKKSKKIINSSDEGDDNSDDDRRKGRDKTKGKRRKYESSSSESENDVPSKRSKSKGKRSSSPLMAMIDDSFTGGVHVYRAIYQERWLGFGFNQAPCGRCQTFDFCKGGGPVNPQECVYYGEWLGKQEVKVE